MVPLRELFTQKRFPLGWKLVPVLIYFPVGFILAIIRIFIAVQAFIAASLLYKLPAIRLAVLRVMCGILGIFVFKENEKVEDESVKIIVSNHVSVFDHLAIYLIKDSVSVQLAQLPSLLYLTFNYRNLGSLRDQKSLIQNVKNFICGDVIIDIQPEMSTTSGKKGLLRFSSWPCKLSQAIQPVAIRIWRPPLIDVAPSIIRSSWFLDVFWFFFVPFTVFQIKFIPVIKSLKNETPDDMTRRLEKAIANELKIETTNYRVTDKIELQKRLTQPNAFKPSSSRVPYPDPCLSQMASKVKEVLPDIPLNIIFRDLAKTRSADITVSNFLEGLVRYIPEKNPSTVSADLKIVSDKTKSSSNPSQPSTSFDTSSTTFHKSARERMISFQERKLKLIQSARQRYIEKHALNIMNSS